MSKNKRRFQPIPVSGQPSQLKPPSLLLLDKFSERDLTAWKARSDDLDALHQVLYFHLEPERISLREEILGALNCVPGLPLRLEHWVRIVDHRYALEPLSAAGSLVDIGGRFNIGCSVEYRMGPPLPGLYLASDHDTAFKEKHGCDPRATLGGLTPQQLTLSQSTTTVRLNGNVARVFDATNSDSLDPIAKILARLSMPTQAKALLSRLKEPDAVHMIRNKAQLKQAITDLNWRSWPRQFDIPAPSQVFGQLVHDAGYEAILYRSSKSTGLCLCVFPDNIYSEETTIELVDPYPPGLKHPKLCDETADELCGWHLLRPRDRPGNKST